MPRSPGCGRSSPISASPGRTTPSRSPWSDRTPRFLNAAATGVFDGTAAELLAALLGVERERGRERPHPGASRTLDLDLIFFGDDRVETPDLIVPHPRFRERRFVLEPLAEVAPDWRDPVTGLTVRDLLARLASR